MAEDNKRKKKLVKLGEKDERYDSYGHKIDRPIVKPPERTPVRQPVKQTERQFTPETKRMPATQTADKRKVRETGERPARENIRQTAKEENKKKLYSSIPAKEEAPHERRIRERAPIKRKHILNAVKVMVILLLIPGVVCMFVFGFGDKKSDLEKAFLKTGTIENIYNVKAQIIRDEYGITAEFTGKMIPTVNDGDRVAAGAKIGYIVKPEYENELEKLRQTDSKIQAAQNASSYVESQHIELGPINEQINTLTDKLSAVSASSSNLSQYSNIIKELNLLFDTKHGIMMNAATTDDYINSLKAQRATILTNLGEYMKEVTSPYAGAVSFYADGEESVVSQKATQISQYLSRKGETGNILSESALQFSDTKLVCSIGAEVTSGQTVARITPDVNYYVSADVSDVDYSVFTTGKEITVRAKNRDFSVEAQVEEVLKYADKTYVLLKSSTGLSGAVSQRIIDTELVIDHMEGIKVPKRALDEWDTAGLTARIAVLRANYVSFVYVNVLAADGEYAIISPSNDFVSEEDEGITSVRINDIYIVNHETVTEGQIIGG